jgi:hypothetical protein
MKPLRTVLLLLFLITKTLSYSPVAVPGVSASTYQNQTFYRNIIQAFDRLNGTWSPEIRSYKTLEDLAKVLSTQTAFHSNADNSLTSANRRSHVHGSSLRRAHHHGSSIGHRASHSTSNSRLSRATEPKAVFAHFMVSLPTHETQ